MYNIVYIQYTYNYIYILHLAPSSVPAYPSRAQPGRHLRPHVLSSPKAPQATSPRASADRAKDGTRGPWPWRYMAV